MKRWYVTVLCDQKDTERRLDLQRTCKTKKEALATMEQLNKEFDKAIKSQDNMVRIDLPAYGAYHPRTIYLRPADYAMITTSIDSEDDGYKGKIGFQCDDDKPSNKDVEKEDRDAESVDCTVDCTG